MLDTRLRAGASSRARVERFETSRITRKMRVLILRGRAAIAGNYR
jgi:hypothetical protein